MIVFNKDSWHYRFAKFFSTWSVPSSLCPYVRAVFFGMLIWTMLASVACFMVFSDVAAIAGVVTGGSFAALPEWIVAGVLLSTLLGAIIACLFIADQVSNYRDRLRSKRYEAEYKARNSGGEYVPPQPPLWRLYLNALHEKMCPVIEFKDNTPPEE